LTNNVFFITLMQQINATSGSEPDTGQPSSDQSIAHSMPPEKAQARSD
jgi:hypothetical protein